MKNDSWDTLKKSGINGKIISGIVIKHETYGVILDLGCDFEGIIQITDFKDEGIMTFDDYPKIGSEIQAKVLGFKDYGCQIWLGVKPSQLVSR